MTFQLKSLLALILLACVSNFVAANNKDKINKPKSFAPVATEEDTKVSFKNIPYLTNAFIDTAPSNEEDEINTGELGVDGGNKEMI